MTADRAELLVAAANAYLAGGLPPRRLARAMTLRPDRHVLPAPLPELLAGVERVLVAGPERAASLRGGEWTEWIADRRFAPGRWEITWRLQPCAAPAPPPTVATAGAALAAELEEALEAVAATEREARVLMTARSTLRGEPSPTASPIRRLRAWLGQEAPRAPRAATIAGGELPAAYPEDARRLFRAAVEAERDTEATRTARAAALSALP